MVDYYDLFLRAYAVANLAWQNKSFPYFCKSPAVDLQLDYDKIENVRLTTMLEF